MDFFRLAPYEILLAEYDIAKTLESRFIVTEGDLLQEDPKNGTTLRLIIETLNDRIGQEAKIKEDEATDEVKALEYAQDLKENVDEYTRRFKESFEESREQAAFLLKQLVTMGVVEKR